MANLHGLLAQWLERLVYTQEAAGSNPAQPTILLIQNIEINPTE